MVLAKIQKEMIGDLVNNLLKFNNMKKQMIAALGALSLLAACSETSEEIIPEVKGEGVYATIEQPVSVDTRGLSWNSGKLLFTWAEGEKVLVFGNKDAASFNSLTSGEKSTKLESDGFTLNDGVDYYACLPAYTIPAATQSTSVPVTFLDQRQAANDNSEHLKSFDYACAHATKAEGENSISFNLENQVAWIVLEHAFTEATNNVTFVTISADEELFVTKGTLDVTTSTITGDTKDSKIALNLGEEDGDGLSFAAGDTFRGFFTLNPVDLSGKTLTFTATTKDGSTITLGTFTKASANLTKNLAVRIKTSGSAAAVATVDGKEYSTVSAALAAASDGATISVVSDVTTGSISIDKSVTIDLGGYTVTSNSRPFVISNDGVEFNLKNGAVVANGGGNWGVVLSANAGKVVLTDCEITAQEGAIGLLAGTTGNTIEINGGVYTGLDNAVISGNGSARDGEPNKITVNGGTFNGKIQTSGYVACGIYAPWKDIIIINGGEFNIENGVGVLCRGGQVYINGGTFTTTDPNGELGKVGDSRVAVPCKTLFVDKYSNYSDYENAQIIVSGGKFSDNACKDYLADGYGIGEVYDQTKKAWYTEVAEAVSEYDGVQYSSLQAAIEASVDATKEITILKDMEVSQLTVNSENKVTINLNGKNVNIPGYKADCTGVNIDGGSLNIKGSGSFGDSAQKNVNPLFYVGPGASLTIEGDATYYSANVCAYARYWNSEIHINGGKWYGSETYTLNKYDDNQEAVISVTGGEFYKYNPAASHSENPVANFVADGYGVIKDGDWYKVVAATEVMDEASLKAANIEGSAIAVNESIVLTEKNLSMQDGTSLYVAKDVVLSSEFTGSYKMTLSYLNNGGVISGEGTIVAPEKKESYTTAIQFNSTNKELVIDGNLTIKGNKAGCWNGEKYIEGMSSAVILIDGKLVINGGHFIGGIDTETGSACPAVYVDAEGQGYNAILEINGGVFESATEDAKFLINCDDKSKGTNTINIKGGTFVGFNPADNTADGAGTNYVAAGYKSTQTTYNGKTAWVVTKE